ncbi:acyltransferase [Kocuria sp. M1R5S2]|uniref:acyltransferase n=1 Tax=Kocuria rhizosphaerae TaxID=3376285 RepID=UPI0037989C91
MASAIVPTVARGLVASIWGASIDRTAVLMPGVHLGGKNITVGPMTFVNRGSFIDDHVRLGQWVQIGQGVTIISTSHRVEGPGHRGGAVFTSPVVIDDGTWLGANVTVLPGVHIGPGCVVGAGAVVTRDCSPDGLYLGVPAQRIRDLPIT